MKTKLLAIVALFLAVALFSACKKEDSDTFKVKISGRWKVNKIEKKTYDANGTTVASSSTTPYTDTDYIDFKNNENDELEINLGSGNRVMGNYVVLMGQSFNISLSDKLLYCNADMLNETTFQFTATVDKSSPKVTETYYLKR
ncbi:uncharacterized lipoprotein YehR (DUF1307 family) [Pedobacter sp. CG_S7]|uniref:hypothetical protein n=1 Tax=Pedobacter sp. CG_S7 TaxID=3143930 RepID=UPI003399062E